MLETMLIHKMDNKGTMKSNLITSCLAFKGSILTLEIIEVMLRG